jgi:cyclase
VVSIEAKLQAPGRWEALTDNGREKTGVDACEWARKAADLGAGEILVTSVDKEGTLKGFDLDLTARISGSVSIPVIACGGAGKPEHVLAAVKEGRADAVAVASLLHFRKCGMRELKETLLAGGVPVRRPSTAAPLS